MTINIVNEASLGRIWQYTKSGRPYAIFTAFRGEYTYKQNVERNTIAVAELRKNGFGYFFVDGNFVENAGTENEIFVKEDSIFTNAEPDDEDRFRDLIISLGRKFNQDAVLIVDSNGANLYDKSGNVIMNLGEIKLGKMGDIYTKLRPEHKNKTFVFEGERDDLSWLIRMAGLKK